MKRYIAVLWLMLFPAVVLAGKPEVIQLSPGTYMISKADHGGIFGGGLPELKAVVIKQANEFAASQGKIAIPLTSSERPMGNGPAQWATFEYQFRVVDKTDPDAQRTSLAPRADTVISIEGTQPQPIAAPTGNGRVDDLYSKLIKLDDLRKRGLISDTEFEAEKRKLLEN
jgi:hypothetical protein